MGRSCAECHRQLDKSSFSKNQWSKGIGGSRCNSCVHGSSGGGGGGGGGKRKQNHHSGSPAKRPASARRNNSSRATFQSYDLDNPFESGTFRWVAKGEYTIGDRAGEPCVCKWFKSGTTLEEQFYADDIKAVDRALKLIEEFNSRGIVDKSVILNIPQVWTFDHESGSMANTKVLQEPFIANYQKFNSNSGWADDGTPWPRVMQALSHFSYHISSGHYVLCDLQGGVYRDGIVLTDPAVLSRRKEYGVTDLGPKGISTFFSQYVS